MQRPISIIILSFIISFFISCQSGPNEIIDLSGEWRFSMDPDDVGVSKGWFNNQLNEMIVLPGSMASNGLGDEVSVQSLWTGQVMDSSWYKADRYSKYRTEGNIKIPFWLQPDKHYLGAAWYQKKISVPRSWTGTSKILNLERCHWETRVWVDGYEVGMRNSLGTPHLYDLSKVLKAGEHKITVRVDNRVKSINPGPNAHSISDHTQSNWNGIVGQMEIESLPTIYMKSIQVFPDIIHKSISVKLLIDNQSGISYPGRIHLKVKGIHPLKTGSLKTISHPFDASDGISLVEVEYPLGEDALLWDEFNPNLYQLSAMLESDLGRQSSTVEFGMRDFKSNGTQFEINGRPVFLRGTLECAIFPKTGYPSTAVNEWERIFDVIRAHGLNHMRFHSWCPPEAAFQAADRKGVYLQVECSSWANSGSSIGDGRPIDQYIMEESSRMLDNYGNHPSFCMLAYGNEPAGGNQQKYLTELIRFWRQNDSRRVYTGGAGWPIIPANGYHNIPQPRIQGWGEELKSIINSKPPATNFDWSDIINAYGVPVVSHEIGQWCVYPNFEEIDKYTGPLKARNFEIFRETLNENGMGHLPKSFLLSSGKLQALCYKADIEAALRTKGMGGFQLLDLHDFPGQGTALVGVLDAFWEEKGYITPEEYRRFCNETVPLLRLDKCIFQNSEELNAEVEVAHFGKEVLKDLVPEWQIVDAEGKTVVEDQLNAQDINYGNGQEIGVINFDFSSISKPQQLTVKVDVGDYANQWDIWVYPDSLPVVDQADEIMVADRLSKKLARHLQSGGKAILSAAPGSISSDQGGAIGVGFSSIFWNTAWTHGQKPHTLGILCDPKHPALTQFPTQFHSNWQWWDAMTHAQAIKLNDFPAEMKPIVRIIDDWFTNRSLGLIIEVKIGEGKLLISGIDLLTNAEERVEARQLLYSLKSYMTGDKFNPANEVEYGLLEEIFIL